MADRTLELALRIRILSERLEELERARDGTEGFKEAVAGLRNQILGLAAALVGLDKLKDFVATGIEVNKELESTKLGIAGIVASQAKLVDSQGRVIEGQAAFNAASQISSDLLQKLKIDSLQTTATFGQLKDAFQAAVSPGLAAGLNLDQIRELTKQIALAAGALGLDMSQVAQETQAILSGNIDTNAVIARNLGITNEMVAQWKEQKTLATELSKRMEGFAQMGDATSKSWSGVTSNLSEAYQTIAGLATAGFYDQIKTKLNDALSGIFNLKTGQLEENLKGVSDLVAEILTDLGGVLGDAIVGIMDGLKSMSGYLQENKGEVEGIRNNFGLVFDQVKALGGELLSVVQSIISAGTEGKVLSTTFEVIAQTIAAFRDGVDFIVMAFTKLGAVVLSALAAPIEQAGKALSLFGLETGKILESLAGEMKEQADAASQSAGQMWENFAQGKTHLNALNQEAEKFRTLVNIPASAGFGTIRDQIQQLAQGMKDAKQPTAEMRTEAERLKSQVEIMFKSGQISRDEYIVAMGKIKTATGEVGKAHAEQKKPLEQYYGELEKILTAAGKFVDAQAKWAEAAVGETKAALDLAKAKGDETKARELNAKLQQQEVEQAQIAQRQLQADLETLKLQRQHIVDAAGGYEKLGAAQRLQVATLEQLIAAKQKDIAGSSQYIEQQKREAQQAVVLAGPLGKLIETYEQQTKEHQRAADASEQYYSVQLKEVEGAIKVAQAKGDEAEAAKLQAQQQKILIEQAEALAAARATEAADAQKAVEAKKLELAADGELSTADKEQIANLEAVASQKQAATKEAELHAEALQKESDALKKVDNNAKVFDNAAQNAYKFSSAQADVDRRNQEVSESAEKVKNAMEGVNVTMAKFGNQSAIAFGEEGVRRFEMVIRDIQSAINEADIAAERLANEGLRGVGNNANNAALYAENLASSLEKSESYLNDAARAASENLRQALADARAEAEAMVQSLAEAADATEKEILRLQGKNKEVYELEHQEKLRQLEEEYKKAGELGDAEYRRAKAAEEELHKLKLKQLQEQADADAQKNANRTETTTHTTITSGSAGVSSPTINVNVNASNARLLDSRFKEELARDLKPIFDDLHRRLQSR